MASSAVSAAPRKSNRRALLLSLAFGALSAILVLAYLNGTRADEKNTQVVTAPVVFAVRDIPERTQIKENMLEVRQIPVDARHALAIEDKSKAVGEITRVKIAAGEQIISAKVSDQVKDVGFSAAIPDGKRAVAVAVTEVIASGGHITPGDYVDVIGVFEMFVPSDKDGSPLSSGTKDLAGGSGNGDKPKRYTSMTILQHIQVLAVAKNADATLENANGDGAKRAPTARQDEPKSVTLAVTPEEAERLFLAEELGKLRLSLRPFGDSDPRTIAPVQNNLSEFAQP